jgi:hypothetical protein
MAPGGTAGRAENLMRVTEGKAGPACPPDRAYNRKLAAEELAPGLIGVKLAGAVKNTINCAPRRGARVKFFLASDEISS